METAAGAGKNITYRSSRIYRLARRNKLICARTFVRNTEKKPVASKITVLAYISLTRNSHEAPTITHTYDNLATTGVPSHKMGSAASTLLADSDVETKYFARLLAFCAELCSDCAKKKSPDDIDVPVYENRTHTILEETESICLYTKNYQQLKLQFDALKNKENYLKLQVSWPRFRCYLFMYIARVYDKIDREDIILTDLLAFCDIQEEMLAMYKKFGEVYTKAQLCERRILKNPETASDQ